jgi:hypothetical protein
MPTAGRFGRALLSISAKWKRFDCGPGVGIVLSAQLDQVDACDGDVDWCQPPQWRDSRDEWFRLVHRQLTRRRNTGETVGFGPLKSARSARVLALPGTLVEALRRHRDRQTAERESVSSWADPRLVFASAVGPTD